MTNFPDIGTLVAQARGVGDRTRAAALWRQIIDRDPGNAEALNALANGYLAQGQADLARPLLARAVAAQPGQAVLHFNLATAHGALGQFVEALLSLDSALAIDPYLVQALFHKAAILQRLGRDTEAAAIYRNYLDCMPPQVRTDPRMTAMVQQAQAAIDADNRALLGVITEKLGPTLPSARVGEAIDLLTGRATLQIQKPTFLTVPRLPAIPYFDEAAFPWLKDLEAGTGAVLEELQQLLKDGSDDDFEPYVARPAGVPVNQWGELNHSRRWSAYHLWLNGVRQDDHCARCPRTAALVESLPRIVVPDRAPNAFFSVLRAGARIPPHTGVTNMRATIHLGLVVPPNCGFRVGNEIRHWRQGSAWAFDDTIEHEAWNDSDQDRIILIVDGWNPFLDAAEGQALSALLAAFDRHIGRAPGWADNAL